MNTEIEKNFKNFEVDGKKIPISFLKYTGKEQTYITYQEINCNPALMHDDNVFYETKTYDFDIYSKNNFLNIIKALKQKLIENDWTWVEDSEDMFETDTSLYHKTITFEKWKEC